MLIKDYKLEVHYHPSEANVVADALSHKAHYNYLPVVHLTREESSIRVLPDLSLHNIAAQKNDEAMAHIRRRMQEGDLKVNCFHENAEETL
jgi:hypothetical protein